MLAQGRSSSHYPFLHLGSRALNEDDCCSPPPVQENENVKGIVVKRGQENETHRANCCRKNLSPCMVRFG